MRRVREVDVTTEIEIARPVAEVSAFVADQSTAPEWFTRIRSIKFETVPPLRVGSRVIFVGRYLGKQVEYAYEVTEWEPERRLVMYTHEGPFPMQTTYTWEPTGAGGTRMAMRSRGRPAGIFDLIAPFGEWELRRSNRRDLQALKAILEARP